MDNTDKIKKIVSKILKVSQDRILGDVDLVSVFDMDSMQRVEIVIELEKEFDVTIPDEDAAKLRTVGAMLSYVESGSVNKA